MKELIHIQSQLKAPKNQINKFGGYRYRSAEDILEAVKPLLNEVGCILTISDSIEAIGNRIYVRATARLQNKDGVIIEVSACAREEENKKGMDAAQITGAASSYARKYALNGLFCIDDTKDPDYTQGSESKDKEEAGINIGRVVEQVRIATTIDELTALWNNFKKYDSDKLLANAITVRRRELGI